MATGLQMGRIYSWWHISPRQDPLDIQATKKSNNKVPSACHPSSCCPWSTHTYGRVCRRLSCLYRPTKHKHTQKPHNLTFICGDRELKYGLYFCNNWGWQLINIGPPVLLLNRFTTTQGALPFVQEPYADITVWCTSTFWLWTYLKLISAVPCTRNLRNTIN